MRTSTRCVSSVCSLRSTPPVPDAVAVAVIGLEPRSPAVGVRGKAGKRKRDAGASVHFAATLRAADRDAAGKINGPTPP